MDSAEEASRKQALDRYSCYECCVLFDCHPRVKMLGAIRTCLIVIERLEIIRVTWSRWLASIALIYSNMFLFFGLLKSLFSAWRSNMKSQGQIYHPTASKK
jgi:hypothetical protein